MFLLIFNEILPCIFIIAWLLANTLATHSACVLWWKQSKLRMFCGHVTQLRNSKDYAWLYHGRGKTTCARVYTYTSAALSLAGRLQAWNRSNGECWSDRDQLSSSQPTWVSLSCVKNCDQETYLALLILIAVFLCFADTVGPAICPGSPGDLPLQIAA